MTKPPTTGCHHWIWKDEVDEVDDDPVLKYNREQACRSCRECILLTERDDSMVVLQTKYRMVCYTRHKKLFEFGIATNK